MIKTCQRLAHCLVYLVLSTKPVVDFYYKMKVGIIGCGPAGLNAIKSCLAEGFDVTAFDQNPEVGGQWYSKGECGRTKYGNDVHSVMYEGLVTNVPKESMEYSDFPYEQYDESFLTQIMVFKYFQSYADAFELRPYIKFNHQVIRARPLIDDKWEIIAKDLPSNDYKCYIFDAVFICIGMSAPYMPKIQGQNVFKGEIIHSRDYRNTSKFTNKTVMLIGSGFSALDMVVQIGSVAEKIAWVHQIKERHDTVVEFERPKCVVEVPAISRITETGAEFVNGTSEEFDIIAYATGYDFVFPFLSVDSGLSVHDKCIYPLYKQCININKPNLFIIGIPFFALAIPMFELQIRFCLEFLSGRKRLPSLAEMLADADENRKLGEKDSHKVHYLGLKKHEAYYRDLAECAQIKPLKPVFGKIVNHSMEHFGKEFLTFRNYKYNILNDEQFVCSCTGKVY